VIWKTKCYVHIPGKAAKGQIKNIGRKPEKINGKIKFQEEIELGVEVENKGNKHVKLRKQKINTAQGLGISVMSTWSRISTL